MARAFRLAGAILVETNGAYFLVGNTKKPCDWAAAGFEPPTEPAELDALKRPYVRLSRCARSADVKLEGTVLTLDIEGEELARRLAQRFLIERNGSVSDRLWRLVVNPHDALEGDGPEHVDARWLGDIPEPIWSIVRDTVLRCI